MLFYDGIVTVAANLKALGPLICTERLDIYLKKKKKKTSHMALIPKTFLFLGFTSWLSGPTKYGLALRSRSAHSWFI